MGRAATATLSSLLRTIALGSSTAADIVDPFSWIRVVAFPPIISLVVYPTDGKPLGGGSSPPIISLVVYPTDGKPLGGDSSLRYNDDAWHDDPERLLEYAGRITHAVTVSGYGPLPGEAFSLAGCTP
jgi:hypothetical protein